MQHGAALDKQRKIYAVYANFSRLYDAIYGRLLARSQRAAVAAACACGTKVLEIGVGTGLTLSYFEPGTRVTGIDLSPEMLAVAQRRVADQNLDHVLGLHVMDACKLRFEDESFDAVTAQFVLTLVPDPERALDEMDRVLKAGGEIIIASRLIGDTRLASALWKALAPAARAVGWSSDLTVSRITTWATETGRYETVSVSGGYFKVVRLRKQAGAAGPSV